MTNNDQTLEKAVRRVPLSAIKIDEASQSRVTIRVNVVNKYAEAMKLQLSDKEWRFPPVVLFQEGEGYWVGDGFHRILACKKVNIPEIPADVRIGTKRDAFLFSIPANADHGLPFTSADKRRAVQILLADPEWSQWSNAEIARRCQASQPFVGRIRAGASCNGYRMRVRKVKRGDTVYEMKVDSKIGQSQSVTKREQTEDANAVSNLCEAAVPELPTLVTTDCLGLPLRPEVSQIFASQPDFKAAAELHGHLAKIVDRIGHSPGSQLFQQHLIPKRENGQLTFCSRSLNFFLKELAAAPHCGYCPRCTVGNGRLNSSCKLCHGRGWLSREEFELCPAHERQEVIRLASKKVG
jgi:hypothetical protein